MPAPGAITCDQLAKRLGAARAPIILDLRREGLRQADPRLIPTARPLDEAALSPSGLAALAAELAGQSIVTTCAAGHGRSQGAAAWLRAAGLNAEYLEGGMEAWRAAALPLIDPGKITHRDPAGRSLWVTRALRCRRLFLEPSWRYLHLRHPADRIRPVAARAGPAGHHRARGRYRPPRSGTGMCRASGAVAGPVAAAQRRSRAAGGRDGALRRALSLGARCHGRDP